MADTKYFWPSREETKILGQRVRRLDGLALATRYQVSTRTDLFAVDGSHTTGTYSFTFTTLRPAVLSVAPPSGTQFALPSGAVQVIFNQPVRRASAQAADSTSQTRNSSTPMATALSINRRLGRGERIRPIGIPMRMVTPAMKPRSKVFDRSTTSPSRDRVRSA